MSSENVTSVEVAWLNHKKDSSLASETEDEELKALCAVDEAEADKGCGLLRKFETECGLGGLLLTA